MWRDEVEDDERKGGGICGRDRIVLLPVISISSSTGTEGAAGVRFRMEMNCTSGEGGDTGREVVRVLLSSSRSMISLANRGGLCDGCPPMSLAGGLVLDDGAESSVRSITGVPCPLLSLVSDTGRRKSNPSPEYRGG